METNSPTIELSSIFLKPKCAKRNKCWQNKATKMYGSKLTFLGRGKKERKKMLHHIVLTKCFLCINQDN